jgi:flagellar export protein FliJ
VTPERKIRTLERLKEIREKVRDETRRRMSQCEEQSRSVEEEVHKLDQCLTGAVADFGRSCRNCRTIDDLWLLREDIEGLEKQLRNAEKERLSLQKELDGLKLDLSRQHADFRIAETILDGHREANRTERLRREEKTLEEIALSRFAMD